MMNGNDTELPPKLAALFREAPEASQDPASDEAFVQAVLRDVRRHARAQLWRETGPWLLAVAGITIASWLLLPQLLALPSLIASWPDALLSSLRVGEAGSKLLPAAVLLLAVLLQFLGDWLPRRWQP